VKGTIVRPIEDLLKFRRYQRRFGIKEAVKKSLQYLANRAGPPSNGPAYPADILWAMEEQPNVAEHVGITKEMNEAWLRNPRPPRRVLWVMPDFLSVHNGGPNTILRFAHYFAQRGAESIIYIFNGQVHRSANQVRKEIFACLGAEPRLKVILNQCTRPLRHEDMPDSDMAVATLWNTAYNLLQYHRTKSKFYLIQDYETQFYPGSVESALADLTYDFGFLGLFNTPGLRDAVTANHALTGSYAFQPGIDHDIFFPRGDGELPDLRRMFFYGRPEVPRNGFSLGMHGLQMIQAAHDDVEVFVAGHPKAYAQSGLRGQFLPYMDYRATGEMYRSCGSLISFMFTPHPSYIPLQAMCCGSIPIARRDRYTSWALKDGHNCLLVDPLPHQILEAYSRLRKDVDLRRHLYENAIRTFDGVTWQNQLQRAYHWMTEGAAGLVNEPAHRNDGPASARGDSIARPALFRVP
jgi:glycosyltransferase involved in cell wall biosynthesis